LFGLWTACGSWSADTLSDGFVPAEIVQRFDPTEKLAKRLVEVGLWAEDEHDDEFGYRFHQWTEHQPTKAEVERRRSEARERMRRNRARSHDVRANNERSSSNAFARTDANRVDDPTADPADPGFYGASNESAQVNDSVRANTQRTAREVRHPDPTRPDLTTKEQTLPLAPLAEPDLFAEFYAAYPRREDRKSAERAWKRVMKAKVDPRHVIAAAQRYAEQTRT